jgi:hypothetical protein
MGSNFDKKPNANLAPWAVGIRSEALNFAGDLIVNSFIEPILPVCEMDRSHWHAQSEDKLGGAFGLANVLMQQSRP